MDPLLLINLIIDNHLNLTDIKKLCTMNKNYFNTCTLYIDTNLSCSYNNLTNLPYLSKVTTIHCAHNNLTSLPSYPKLKYISCDYNNFTTLPYWPKIIDINCMDNINLTKLPVYPSLRILSLENTGVRKLPIFPNLYKLYYDIGTIRERYISRQPSLQYINEHSDDETGDSDDEDN